MIQTTNRLSRGGRLRRAKPIWLYGLAATAGVVLLGMLIVLKH
jgi:hypothetical protein